MIKFLWSNLHDVDDRFKKGHYTTEDGNGDYFLTDDVDNVVDKIMETGQR